MAELTGLAKVRALLERMNRKGGLGLDVHGWIATALDELDALSATGAEDAEPLFRRRTPEAAARQMAIVLMNLLECQYATLEGMPKRTSQYERKRQESIAGGYLRQLMDLDIQPDQRGLRGYPCPRVRDAMIAARTQSNGAAGGGEVSHGE